MIVQFLTQSGGRDTLKVQNVDIFRRPIVYNAPTEDITGGIHTSIRGYRWGINLHWDESLQKDQYEIIINNILSDLLGGNSSITLIIDNKNIAVAPSGAFMSRVQYERTIGIFSPVMEFIAVDNSITLDSRYVDEGYVTEEYV